MAREIPGVPQHVVDWSVGVFSGRFVDIIWKLLLLLVGGAVLLAMATSGVFLLTFIAGVVIAAFLADDITQTARDIWSRNWWVWRS